jgi:hypothetical protein
MTCPSNTLKVFLVLIVLSCTVTVAYTVPGKVPIQGRLTNVSTGVALTGPYTFTFRVYNASTGGTKLWEENQSLTVDSGGLWSTYLGNNTPLDFSFSEDMYIEMEINHDNDPLPRVQLATVPYSKRTDIAANLSCVDCVGGDEINESTLSGVNAAQLGGQASTYFLNISSAYGGDVSGTYDSIKVNASKIDTGTLSSSYIQDAYLLNTGDNASGSYNFDSDTLYVDSSNHRIGIGTSTPTYKLEVIGGVNVTGNLTTPLVCLNGDCRTTWPTGSGISSAGGWINTSAETYSALDVNLSNKFFFNSSSGYVGIGTMSPLAALSVGSSAQFQVSSTGAVTAVSINGNTFTAGTGTLTLGAGKTFNASNTLTLTATDGAILAIGSGGTLGTGAYATIANYAPLASPTFTGSVIMPGTGIWNTSGNVGIGTTSPISALDVRTANANYDTPTSLFTLTHMGNNPTLNVNDTAGDRITFRGQDKDGNVFDIGYLDALMIDPNYNGVGRGGDLVFSTLNNWIGSNTPTERLRITNNGNVGIGTTNPAGTLHVRVLPVPITATGGTITYSGGYTIHTFTSSGTFTPNGSGIVDVLVVAGGGGGGYSGGAGGGAGGYQYIASLPVTGQGYAVTVGAGGAGSSSNSVAGGSGDNSAFSTITAYGGGGGGSWNGATNGVNGGSGGGASADSAAHTAGSGSQGNSGGVNLNANPYPSGGGGGAGAVGAAGVGSQSGAGGAGTANLITGSSVTYAGGGGGGGTGQGAVAGSGGAGGGGAGSANHSNAGTAGTANTGGGGGGGVNSMGGAATNGGAGGSGIVIVRYLTTANPIDSLVVDSMTGNVGIGTTGPIGTLNVHSASSDPVTWLTRGDNAVGNTVTLRLGNNEPTYKNYSPYIQAIEGAGIDAYALAFGTSNVAVAAERMRITSTGNVGIGTTTPGTYKLNIAGTGYLGAAAWVYSSDRRLKQNISYLDGSSDLDKIMMLKPARFDYISGEKNQLGFIAQDVQNAIPEAVVADAETGMLGLKTDFMIPYLVKGMQEQQGVIQDQQKRTDRLQAEKDAEISALKVDNGALTARIDSLSAENGELKADNEALKQAVCEINPKADICAGV